MMMVWGEILFFKREKKAGGEGGRKEKLLKVEYGFGYGLTHGLSMLFSYFVENNIFLFSFFSFENHCMFNLPFLSIGLFVVTPSFLPLPFSQ